MRPSRAAGPPTPTTKDAQLACLFVGKAIRIPSRSRRRRKAGEARRGESISAVAGASPDARGGERAFAGDAHHGCRRSAHRHAPRHDSGERRRSEAPVSGRLEGSRGPARGQVHLPRAWRSRSRWKAPTRRSHPRRAQGAVDSLRGHLDVHRDAVPDAGAARRGRDRGGPPMKLLLGTLLVGLGAFTIQASLASTPLRDRRRRCPPCTPAAIAFSATSPSTRRSRRRRCPATI